MGGAGAAGGCRAPHYFFSEGAPAPELVPMPRAPQLCWHQVRAGDGREPRGLGQGWARQESDSAPCPWEPGISPSGICSHARTVLARGCPREKAGRGGNNMAGQREKEGGEQRDHVTCGRFTHRSAARTLQGEEKSRDPHRRVGGNEIPSDFTSSHSQTDTIFPALPHCSRISK